MVYKDIKGTQIIMSHKLLIVIPYRDREEHLKELMSHLTIILNKQNIEHSIVVIEQEKGKLFNRGMLCNIGFDLYNKENDYVCFHDVDMICNNIDYSYSEYPVCLITSRTKNLLIYNEYFGGITLFDNQFFLKINGFSNNYWGWGAEDDDLYQRCKLNNITISPRRDGHCNDLELTNNTTNRNNNPNYNNNLKYLLSKKTLDIINNDGLNNLNNLYKINNITKNIKYTQVLVNI